jgi:hypothetical protein
MRVRHLYHRGCFRPCHAGADAVAANQLAYCLARGWNPDCVVACGAADRRWADRLRRDYEGVGPVTVVDLPPTRLSLREQLFAAEHASQSPAAARALGAPADLIFTNSVLTSPLLRLLPKSCKRVLESAGALAPQFAPPSHQPGAAGQDPLGPARQAFLLRTELELYRLYDAILLTDERAVEFVRTQGLGNAGHVPQARIPFDAGPARRAAPEHDLVVTGGDAPASAHGITWFYRHVYVPYLWRRGVRLLVAGAVCNALDFRDLHVTLRLDIAESPGELYSSAKVAVVPALEDAGPSSEGLDALAAGCALVLTPPAARDLSDASGAYVKLDVRANPRRAAEVILGLLAAPEKRAELRQAALDYVRREFGRERYFRALDRALTCLGFGQAGEPGAA